MSSAPRVRFESAYVGLERDVRGIEPPARRGIERVEVPSQEVAARVVDAWPRLPRDVADGVEHARAVRTVVRGVAVVGRHGRPEGSLEGDVVDGHEGGRVENRTG